MTPLRNYRPMLVLADDLQGFGGYLGPEAKQQRNRLQTQFDQKRREFVYDLIKSEPDRGLLWPTVAGDLDRIEASGEHHPGAIDLVREELEKHIAKQVGNHPILRFATRWALPAIAAGAAILHFYLQYNRN
jgi:hypothetical protein